MRSAPAATAASKTFFEPSTLIGRLSSAAWRTVNARWTTTSAPFTASRTLAASWTSPCRYSVLRQPRLFGSNGRRAMPTIRFTRRERSSAETSAMPRSPVGPVTATLRPACCAMPVLYRRGSLKGRAVALRPSASDVLAVAEHVGVVGPDRVDSGPAVHDVPAAVDDVDRVVARARRDHVAAVAPGHRVVPAAELDPVLAGAAVDREGPGDADDRVVVGAAVERGRARVAEDLVVAGAPV